MIAACPSLTCSLRGVILKGPALKKQHALDDCVCIFCFVCIVTGFVDWLKKGCICKKSFEMCICIWQSLSVLMWPCTYDRVWVSWCDLVLMTDWVSWCDVLMTESECPDVTMCSWQSECRDVTLYLWQSLSVLMWLCAVDSLSVLMWLCAVDSLSVLMWPCAVDRGLLRKLCRQQFCLLILE